MPSKKHRSSCSFANTKKATRRKKVYKYSIRTEMMRFCSSDKLKRILVRFSSVLAGVYIFSHVTSLDQFLASKQMLVFSVTPFKKDQNKKSKPFNRLSPESGNRRKVDMQRPSPRLIQVTAIFLMEDMRRYVFLKFIEICMETPCWCPPRMGTNMAAGN